MKVISNPQHQVVSTMRRILITILAMAAITNAQNPPCAIWYALFQFREGLCTSTHGCCFLSLTHFKNCLLPMRWPVAMISLRFLTTTYYLHKWMLLLSSGIYRRQPLGSYPHSRRIRGRDPRFYANPMFPLGSFRIGWINPRRILQ